MSAFIALLADLLKLPPAAVGATLVVLAVALVVWMLAVSIRCGFRYLERRSDNKLIDKHIEKSTEPQPVVIQAIRGTAIAGAATASSDSEVVDAEVDGLARRLTGWMRELKPPGG